MFSTEKYEADGYCAPMRVMTAAEAAHYRAQMEASEAQVGRILDRRERSKPHLLFKWAAELTKHPAVLAPVHELLGPDLLCWETVLFTKEPNGPEFITWHQDVLYWGLDPADEVLTAWIALSPSTPESGCMRVVPGSHKLDLQPHKDTFAEGNLLSRGQIVTAEVRDEDAVDLTLQPGEMSLHHVKIIHGSDYNRSDDRRIGFAARYFRPSVRQKAKMRDSAFHVSGADPYHHFDLETAPDEDWSPAARAAHEHAVNRRRELQLTL